MNLHSVEYNNNQWSEMSYTLLYDLSIYLDQAGRICKVNWANTTLRQKWQQLSDPDVQPPESYIGKRWNNIKGLQIDSANRLLFFHNKVFHFQKEEQENGCILFLKEGPGRETIFKKALDMLDESIQIYDKDGIVVYFNQMGREVAGVQGNIEGRHLLDIFNVREEESTTLKALRTNIPVRNRFQHYSSKKGKELFTVISAFPLTLGNEVIAALVLEESIRVISRKAEQLQNLQNAMQESVLDTASSPQEHGYTFMDLVGHHPKIIDLRKLAQKAALQNTNILIVGETGTGKEILAQSIHKSSLRSNYPFVALNCAAIPENLVESILFGTAKGSYTGSIEKPGLLEEADKGTIFLDELNSMTLAMQAKVLRVLQEGTFRRVGGNQEYQVDVRVISSCNEDPFTLIDQKTLRSDLFYRLATIILEIPPLRDRVEDIEELIWHHIRQLKYQYAFPFRTIEPDALWQLQQYPWPGNVRELFHAVEYAMNLASDDSLRLEYLPPYCRQNPKTGHISDLAEIPSRTVPGTLQEQVDTYEAEVIRKALKEYGGNVSQTARKLGLHRQGLQYRMRKYGIIN